MTTLHNGIHTRDDVVIMWYSLKILFNNPTFGGISHQLITYDTTQRLPIVEEILINTFITSRSSMS